MASTIDQFYQVSNAVPPQNYEGIFGVTDSSPFEPNNAPIRVEDGTLDPFRGHISSSTGHDGSTWKTQLSKSGAGSLFWMIAGYQMDTGDTAFYLDWRITIDGNVISTVTNYISTGLVSSAAYALDIVGLAQNSDNAYTDKNCMQVATPLHFNTSVLVETRIPSTRGNPNGQVNSKHMIAWKS